MQDRNARERAEKKRKLADLLDKYGESKEAIDKNADVNDSFEYMLANGDRLIDEVLEERRRASELLKKSKPAKQDDCYMDFDGQNLRLYKNGQKVDMLDAMSGHSDYQSSKYQHVKNKVPIPEGTYYADQDQRQDISLKDAAFGVFKHGIWSGSIPAWG